MARCRIYLFTYKRNELLKRAVKSLLDQQFGDWVCEVHNDCSEDPFPEKYIASLQDERFVIHNHKVNLGAVMSFNLAFAGCCEAYASILEDDNWWEPRFLTKMIGLMDSKPTLDIAWSNMRVWQQVAESQFKDTQKNIWATDQDTQFFWPDHREAMGALHSNGAMIYRGIKAIRYVVPDNCEFGAVEIIRERTFNFPIYLVAEPLANFSRTLKTSRTNTNWIWTATQMMTLASFVSAVDNPKKTFEDALRVYRAQRPSPAANFFLAALFLLKNPGLLKFFTVTDWYFITKWIIKNTFNIFKIGRYLKLQHNVYNFLLNKTRVRYYENAR